MTNFYKPNTANYPRSFTDNFFINYNNNFKFSEITDKTAHFIEKEQLLDKELWLYFVEQFTRTPDIENFGWRCEFWGKMMRGACLVYSYTKNPVLLETLTSSVRHIMTKQDERGRISTYPVCDEFKGWDMWGRKYVLLGMQYFLEINEDEVLRDEIIVSMCRQVDYLIGKLGNDEGKIRITRTSRHWYGLNSSSILEPVVRLYNITGDKKYLDFAQYIADEGGTYADNIFYLAKKKELRLWQYPVTKAYEMISCFEGLLELYRVTKTDWYKTALVNFADLILEDELTVIGCSGCTHELFDHSAVRQANTNNHNIMQETCVTVTLMKFFLQLNLLMGDAKYIDAFERSYYNAYLGSVNTNHDISKDYSIVRYNLKSAVMTFDSYSPLTAGGRGYGVGGLQPIGDGKFYGCCVCIAAAGIGSVPKAAVLSAEDGIVLNLYLNGTAVTETPSGKKLTVKTDTAYPTLGNIKITISLDEPEEFTFYLRNPQWSKNTTVLVCGEAVSSENGYIKVSRKWEDGDTVELELDMRTEFIRPTSYGSQVLMNKVIWGENSITAPSFDKEDPAAKNHFALRRGPLMLARDSRLEPNIRSAVTPKVVEGYAEVTPCNKELDALFTAKLTLADGNTITLCDYSSAGKDWENSELAVWMQTTEQ